MSTISTERKIEVVGEFNHIQVRDVEVTTANGVEVSRKDPHRYMIGPTDSTNDPELQALKAIHHTPAIIAAFNALGE